MKPISRGSKAGFTLVELIVVIAILAILAGVAIPVYSGYIEKANQAADETLLAAVNTAYAAACLENDKDPRDVSASATLSDGKLTSVAPYNDSFARYFAGNENSKFKIFKTIGYDQEQGVFVGDGGTYFHTVTLNGKQVTVAVDAAAYEAIVHSAFGDSEIMTMQDLMDMVAGTTKTVANFNINYNDPENVLARAIANDDYAYFLLKTAGALDGMNENDAKQLASYYAIYSNSAYVDESGALNEEGTVAFLSLMQKNGIDITNEDSAGATLQEMLQSCSDASEKVSAFESSAGKGSDGVNYNENMLVLYAAQQTSSGFDTESALTAIRKYCGNTGINGILTDGIIGNGEVNVNSVSIPGSNFANAALAYALATAYGERNNLSYGSDARAVMAEPGFVNYLSSEECMADIDGYLSCMNLLTENMESGNIDSAYVAQNGFNTDDIIAALSEVFNQNP